MSVSVGDRVQINYYDITTKKLKDVAIWTIESMEPHDDYRYRVKFEGLEESYSFRSGELEVMHTMYNMSRHYRTGFRYHYLVSYIHSRGSGTMTFDINKPIVGEGLLESIAESIKIGALRNGDKIDKVTITNFQLLRKQRQR
jgi:hypothetical protein